MNKNFDTIIIGNGSIGCGIAFELLSKNINLKIALIGPIDFNGSASLAAGAMLNNFGEIEYDTLSNKYALSKIKMLIKAKKMWPQHLKKLNNLTKNSLKIKKGTIVLNNGASDSLDDLNFKSIISGLKKFKEKYEIIENNKKIKGYDPFEKSRSFKSIYIPNEDYIDNPEKLLNSYYEFFRNNKNIDIINGYAEQISLQDKKVKVIKVNNLKISAPNVVIANGAYAQNLFDQLKLKNIPKLFFGSGNALIGTYDKKINQQHVIRTPNRGMACGLHVVPMSNNHIYIGATNRVSDSPINYPICSGILGLQQSLIKEINKSYSNLKIKKTLVGHRPTTLDTYPIIGPTSIVGLYVASGTKRDGLTLSPLIGKIIADLILKKKQTDMPSFFYPERKPLFTMSVEQGIEKSIKHSMSAAYQHNLELPHIDFENTVIKSLKNDVINIYKLNKIKKGIPPEILSMYKYKKT